MLLSVMICSMNSRSDLLAALLEHLNAQAVSAGETDVVEILTDVDDGEKAIGRKRNDLMARARGEYVCFVDDDDRVADTYVEDVLRAIRGARPDCVGIVGELSAPQKGMTRFVHSLRFVKYRDGRRALCRPPNHLNPIRREIALRYKFPHVDRSEDTAFAMQMADDRALRIEVFIPKTLYFYEPSSTRRKASRR